MDLSALPSLILSVAQARSLDRVLGEVVAGILRQPGIGLARLWLKCNKTGQLDLRASGGMPLNRREDWSRLDGKFARVPLDTTLKLGHIAVTGQPVLIRDLIKDREWMADRDWAAREKLTGFVGEPLLYQDQVLGVLAMFTRFRPDESTAAWLRVFAGHAAIAIANTRLREELELHREYLIEEVRETGAFGDILGSSEALAHVLRQVDLVAATGANVLIEGESGTGKELIARAIHSRSPRAAKPLIKVNCASIPRELFESEFFGHVKGSFTGAIRDRVGRFELADGGTLFLDEVGEIPLDLQSKLLRTLQEGEFERVGEERTRRVMVRVVAATNRDLEADVAAGRFRLDLYYRLAVFPMKVPALRERREDIAALAAHFLDRARTEHGLPLMRLTSADVRALEAYDWPGNVRELQNVIERAAIVARGGALRIALGPSASQPRSPKAAAFVTDAEWRERERTNLSAALAAADGRIAGKGGAADLLGLSPSTLTSRLKALGLSAALDRRPSR